MRVLIIGGGEVGAGTASRLTRSGHAVTVVDKNIRVLTMLQERADIQVVHGDGTSPRVLKKAGMESCDMIIAVTDSDQVNMLSILLAGTLRNNPIKVARIKNSEYEYNSNILEKGGLNLDLVINQDKEATKVILDLVKYPHMSYFSSFFSDRLYCVAFKYVVAMADHLSRVQKAGLQKSGWLPFVVERGDKWIDFSETAQLFEGDTLYCAVMTEKLRALYDDIYQSYNPPSRIVILGGGELGFSVAKRLEKSSYQVKLIESDRERCFEIAERLKSTIVLHGQGSDENLLVEENVGDHDLFIATNEDEEVNILSCLLAKRLGTARVIALSNKISYLPLLNKIGIDVSISSRLIAMKKIMAFIRSERVSKVEIIGDGHYELMECEVFESDDICGKKIADVAFPAKTMPVALLHLGEVVMDIDATVVQPKDRLLMLTAPDIQNAMFATIEKGTA